MKLIVRGAMVGVIIGLVNSIVFSYLFANGEYYPMSPHSTSGSYFYEHLTETTIFIIALLSWALLGVGFAIAGKIFQKEDWTILKMTVTHFATVLVFFLPLSIVSGWYPLKTNAIILFLVLFVVIYVLIWIVMLTINMLRIKKINSQL